MARSVPLTLFLGARAKENQKERWNARAQDKPPKWKHNLGVKATFVCTTQFVLLLL